MRYSVQALVRENIKLIAATGTPGPDLQHACGFARGCIASWQMVKTLSRLANAPVGQPEPDADTTRAGLDQYQS
jgi:hypothetical protein